MLADLAPTPLAMAVQVSCSLVTTVLSGVVIASQEFRLQSLVYFSGLVLVFTPLVLIVANDPEIEMSIAWLLWANAAYQCWLCAGQVIPPAPSSLTAAARGVGGMLTPATHGRCSSPRSTSRASSGGCARRVARAAVQQMTTWRLRCLVAVRKAQNSGGGKTRC